MSERIDYIKIDSIEPNPDNPRKNFDQEALEQLSQSIREVGILQPLVVVPISGTEPQKFRLVCGERRWRAAQLAGMESVPVVVEENLTQTQIAEIMLIENLQRKDLDPIEEARAYQTLLQGHGYTQEGLGEKLGVSQGHIANRLRLLELPDEVQENISREIISPSHGRVLAGFKKLPERMLKKAAETIAEKGVSVAKTTKAVMKIIAEEGKPLFNDYTRNNKPEFKTSQCEKCEYRVMGNRWDYGNEDPYCINPSCWEKKQQEVRRERELALADRVQKAAKNGQGVVELDKFQYDQYEEFSEYKIKDMDLSECQECEHKKVAKRSYSDELTEACFQPSCFKKKQAVATREKNKQARDAFLVELKRIAELASSAANACSAINIPRQVLVYLAAQVLANIQNSYERKITRYQFVKEKFGWQDDLFKYGAYQMLLNDWDTFRSRLETLSNQQLWQIIFEWPAAAKGLEGAKEWFLNQTLEHMPLPEPRESDSTNISVVTGRIKRCMDCANIQKDKICASYGFARPSLTSPQYCPYYVVRKDVDIELIPKSADECIDPKRYLDKKGRELFVSKGLGDEFGIFWKSPTGGLHRVKSPAMPMVTTAKEAQAHLDNYAKAKGLKPVTNTN